MKYCILYNPLAGTGDMENNAWLKSMRESGKEILETDITTLPNRAAYKTFLAGLSADDAIVICGGDGTINRFANATDGLDIPQDILYYPSGTGNDFLKDIGMTGVTDCFSIKKYLQDLPTVKVQGKTYRFINNVGFGIDGYCCEVGDAMKAANEGRKKPKPVNYTTIAIKGCLFHFKPCDATVTVDGVEHRYKKVWICPTMKGRYYGGGMIATPDQDRMAEDKHLSVMLMHDAGRIKTLLVFSKIFKGEHIKHTDMVTVMTGHDIHVKFDASCALQIDGETFTNVTEYHAKA